MFAILVVLAVILDVLAEMLFVFAVTLLSSEVILNVFEATVLKIEVILAVFELINVGNVAMVDELMPPTLTTVGAVAVPPKSFVN